LPNVRVSLLELIFLHSTEIYKFSPEPEGSNDRGIGANNPDRNPPPVDLSILTSLATEQETESDEFRSATALLALRDTDLRPVEIYVCGA
jgi:hypothetical protein